MSEFVTPPAHVNFRACKLFEEAGEILEVSIAYLQPSGGGPLENHIHPLHDHLFLVTQGEARLMLDSEVVLLHKDEAYRVLGEIPHSVWNNIEEETVMIGISVKKKKD